MNLINKILWRFNLNLNNNYPRSSIKFIRQHFKGYPLIGAEIGTYTGGNAKSILNTLNIGRLYLIDPYEYYPDYGNSNTEFERAKNKAIKNVKKFRNNVTFIKKYSSDALNDVPLLDFIYIDGNHNYKYVKQDIEDYWKKIKINGIMAGHDFNSDCPGVIKAVTEFCAKKKLNFSVETKDWWIVKTKV